MLQPYARVYIFFFIFAPKYIKIVGTQRGGSNMYPHDLCFSKNKKNIIFFSTENFHFLQLYKSLYIAWTCFRNVNSHSLLDEIPTVARASNNM